MSSNVEHLYSKRIPQFAYAEKTENLVTVMTLILKFGLVGIVNTCCGLSLIFFCKYFLALNDIISNLSGYIVGFFMSFLLNRIWTFRAPINLRIQLYKYLISFVLAYLVNLATFVLLAGLGVDRDVAHVASLIPYTVTFFLLSKYFVFREPSPLHHKLSEESS